ncbi:MAG TPA: ROK family protein [Acidobacteriota bacterium]|nr:ROK family protein [Acidobacteriota bacterium]
MKKFKERKTKASGKRTLAIDVGGTGLKASVLDSRGRMMADRVRIDTPYPCPPRVLVEALNKLIKPLPAFDRVSVGFPGVVRAGRILTAPHFGNHAWKGFDLAAALSAKWGKPVRILNDADMQGLAVIRGKGVELVVTLGTGVGTGLYWHGHLAPHLELAHHPLRKGETYNEHVGDKTLKKIGVKKWNRRLRRALATLRVLINFDRLYIGGGNASKINLTLDPDMKIVSNTAGILGGVRLWEHPVERI